MIFAPVVLGLFHYNSDATLPEESGRSSLAQACLLRTFVKGHYYPEHLVKVAIRCLEEHHSVSQLPQQARAFLAGRYRVMAQPWRCGCGAMNKMSASYCPACGSHWKGQRAASPRARRPNWQPSAQQHEQWKNYDGGGWEQNPRRPKSPRSRGKGTGKQPSEGKAEQLSQPSAPPPPTTAQLPKPPSRAMVPGPTPPSSKDAATSAALSEEKAALDKLIQAMSADETGLSPQLRELLEQHRQQDTRVEAKNMHRMVAQKAAAKKSSTSYKRREETTFMPGLPIKIRWRMPYNSKSRSMPMLWQISLSKKVHGSNLYKKPRLRLPSWRTLGKKAPRLFFREPGRSRS